MSRRWDKFRFLLAIAALSLFPSAAQAQLGVSPIPIEDPSGKALSSFFASLDRTERREKGAITRVAHYGDSLIVGDLITKTLRRLYQKRYGDAGPGFILAGRPWPWYRHQGILGGASKGWRTYRAIKGPLRDGLYGLGAVAFSARPKNQRVWLKTSSDGSTKTAVSSVDVHYLAHPTGGDFDILIDGEHIVTLSTKGTTTRSAFHALKIPDGPHQVELRTAGGGEVRLFGVALERSGPGVVYDSLGINGACATVLGQLDGTHLTEQLRHRRTNLVVLMFGANESNRPALVKQYRANVLPIVQQLRKSAPGASCLLMSPMDRGERRPNARQKVRTNPRIPRIVEAQRQIAFEAGCAFYNTYEAMGGELSMYRWSRRGLASSDLTHPTPEGGALIGTALYDALEQARATRSR